MARVTIGQWRVEVATGELPASYLALAERAQLREEFDLKASDAQILFVAVHRAGDWLPVVTIAEGYAPWSGGFEPGVLIVPETDRLFVGAGTRLLAYDLRSATRLWEDVADVGFWAWDRTGDFVLMTAELEFAVWSAAGVKLWTTFVEPPWDYTIERETVRLDIMGSIQTRRLVDGTLIATDQ